MPYRGYAYTFVFREDFEKSFPDISPEAAGLEGLEAEGRPSLLVYTDEYDDRGDRYFLWDVLPQRASDEGLNLTKEQAERLQNGLGGLPSYHFVNAG